MKKIKRGDHKKAYSALLINDTRSDNHIGCQLVVSNLIKEASNNAIEISETITTAELFRQNKDVLKILNKVKLTLVNGEGSLHDSKPRSIRICELGELSKKASKPTFLINSHWSNNSTCAHHLNIFDMCYFRDSTSLEEANQYIKKGKARLSADLIFLSPKIKKNTNTTGIVVTDSVKKKKSIKLAKFAIKNNARFYPMSDSFNRKNKWNYPLRLALHLTKNKIPDDYYNTIPMETLIANSSCLITGRFHAACLALLNDTPFIGVSSNTAKIEALCKDFDLKPAPIQNGLITEQIIQETINNHGKQISSIHQNLSAAKKRIRRMFTEIRDLVDVENF